MMELSRRELMKWFGGTSVTGILLPTAMGRQTPAWVATADHLVVPVAPLLSPEGFQLAPGEQLVIKNIRMVAETNMGTFELPADGPFPETVAGQGFFSNRGRVHLRYETFI